MEPYHYIAGYKFLPLDDLSRLRSELYEKADAHGLRGTILLSPEGTNIFLAGVPDQVDAFVNILKTYFPNIEFKTSTTVKLPFVRLFVKIKKEIIPFQQPDIDPLNQPAPFLSTKELKQWYDEGRDFVMLDTRNDYEFRVGTFKNAIHLDLKHFRDFPTEVQKLLETHRKKTIVTFCTGGIRCEKAAPYMQQVGFENVLQLEGGMLKYLEEFSDAHYEGDCFVFDRRVAVTPDLQETNMRQCYACRSPLTGTEGCPYCKKESTDFDLLGKTDPFV